MATLWHGRFEGGPAEALQALNDSLPFDRRMFREDIAGSRAHVRMLSRVGLMLEVAVQVLIVEPSVQCLKEAYVYLQSSAGRGVCRKVQCETRLPMAAIGCQPLPNLQSPSCYKRISTAKALWM